MTSAATAAALPQSPRSITHRITLITGDVAELTTSPGGKPSARLIGDEPYYFGSFDGDLSLVPASAYPLLTAGRLDRRLFNLTELVAQGYDDAATQQLPLIVTGPAPKTAAVRRTLSSVGSSAISVAKSDAKSFWQSAADQGKIWLDGRTRATLDRSTKQIGAPTAWRSGYDGRGVKVAVLDTGYDVAHPDLAPQVVGSQSFIPNETVQDKHGHGTHTASVVAGLGTASAGKRKGVAPGADLLIGKVLDDAGNGSDSEAIAGMEWAVAQGAKVVNMSLGGWPTDGTDPMSQAVDRLAKSSGALFVVAAGNAGAEETVGTPGAATEALTVGAVDRDDSLAKYSSRGPRLGDGAIKPEVTAPGTEIAAARAAGTTGGHVLDRFYTTMSGTSMATPHVAGAAAILAQRHPEWTGAQLKAALTTTAVPTKKARPDEQGLGRIDIPKALDPTILPSTGNLFLGAASKQQIAYRNNSNRPVTLQLSVDARSASGIAAAVAVSPAKLIVPARGTASATVTLDRAKTSPAKYAGVLTARSGATSYRTGLGFAADGRLNKVTVKAIGRNGKPANSGASGVQLWNQATGDVTAIAFDATGSKTVEVPTGRYAVMAYAMGVDEADWTNSVTLLGDPDEWIDGDRAYTFDARRAHKVTVKTPRRAEAQSVGIAWNRQVGARNAVSGWVFNNRVADNVFVQDFAKVANGTFQVVQRWDLAQPELTVDVPGLGRLPSPDKGSFRTPYVGVEKLPLTDKLAGSKGKAVLLRFEGHEQVAEQLRAAKAAGAKLVFMYNEAPGFWSTGADEDIPFYLLRAEQGRQLLALLKKGATSLQLTGLRDATYRYDLAVGPSSVRGPLTYDIARMRPATVTTAYQRNDAWFLHSDQRVAHLPGIATGLTSSREVSGPVTRTDYLATDLRGVTWDEKTAAGEWNESGIESTLPRAYRPGEQVNRSWWEPLMRPAVPAAAGEEADGWPPARFENALRIAMPQYVNGDRTVYGWGDRGDVTAMKLRSNGVELGSADWSVGQFDVPAKAAWYDLTLDQRRGPNSWAKTSTATQTHWRFQSARGRGVLPLIQIDYRRSGELLQLKAAYQPGYRGASVFRTTAEISTDGKTWRRLALDAAGRARVPAAGVSLRVSSADLRGNSIKQTIENAW
nr:S8 family serine peptidase [Kribbella sandramycini]